MGDMLSQAEIDALLNGDSSDSGSDAPASGEAKPQTMNAQEMDALVEISNLCMVASANTLFSLTGKKVNISEPQVEIKKWDEIMKNLSEIYTDGGCVAVKVEYVDGFSGSNLLMLKEQDVKIITDLMMGGEGKNTAEELNDLHISAIGEAMNQMIGSSATSMSTMFAKKVQISPPNAFAMKFNQDMSSSPVFDTQEDIVKISFKLEVEGLISSQIMQMLPMSFANILVSSLLKTGPVQEAAKTVPQQTDIKTDEINTASVQNSQASGAPAGGSVQHEEAQQAKSPVNVQPANFQSFEEHSKGGPERENINFIMDIPLQVTVELGRTQKLIRNILEFGQGTIIELDKLAGEPVDILVNGKSIAKGEVVVIDESFGVRITDIIHPSKRI